MVPPNWEHPRKECKHSPWAGGCSEAKAHGGLCYQPLYNQSFKSAAAEWKDEFASWERGERPEYCGEESKGLEFWEYSGEPPDREYYRPDWKDGEATWLQVYETVSEGTPVSPPFATREELIDYLSAHDDFWSQSRGESPPSRAACEAFVKDEYAPSMTFSNGVIRVGIETAD